VTTDLTGDFELGEDEFDWDVFLPDPDEADMEAEASALENEAELSLDDSDFDWDGALRDDAGSENAAADEGRAGAAYDRIVDTVRRSVEDEPSTGADNERETDTIPAFGAQDESEQPHGAEREPVVTGFAAATSFADAPGLEADPDRAVEWASEATLEPDDAPAVAIEPAPAAAWRTEPVGEAAAGFGREPDVDAEPHVDLEAGMEDESELDHWLTLDEDPLLAAPEAEPPVAFEPVHTTDPVEPQFVEAAATALPLGVIGAVEAAPLRSSRDHATWAMAPTELWEVDGPAEPTSDSFFDHAAEEAEEEPKRSLVFKATVVLACLFLVVAGAVLAVRALHHPTTTAAPPARVTTPTQVAAGTGSSGTSSTGTAASATARMQTATDAVDSATTAASVGLTSLSAFPTPTNVETVINPYISSLQLYATFLSGTKVPSSAQPAAATAEAKIRQDLQFLETIDGLPAQQLGAFLVQFDTDATQLQTTLSTLEQELRTPAS
jgi:hypothetical protein